MIVAASILLINSTTDLVQQAPADDWVLRTGIWNNSEFWKNDAIYKNEP